MMLYRFIQILQTFLRSSFTEEFFWPILMVAFVATVPALVRSAFRR